MTPTECKLQQSCTYQQYLATATNNNVI